MSRKNRRKFGGKEYKLYKIVTAKHQPKKAAKAMQYTLKHQGFLSRVTEDYPDTYVVWYRKQEKYLHQYGR